MEELVTKESTELVISPEEQAIRDAEDAAANNDLTPSTDAGYIKIVHALSSELRKEFKEGSIVLMPLKILLYDPETAVPVRITACYHWSEFSHWRSRKDKTNKPIIDKTYNKNHPIALNATSKDKTRRFEYAEGHPKGSKDAEKWRNRFVHHLCFAVTIHDKDINLPVVLRFDRGIFFDGIRLMDQILMRGIPMYKQRFCLSASTNNRKGPDGDAYLGFDLVPDPVQPVVSAKEEKATRLAHRTTKAAFLDGNLNSYVEDELNTDEDAVVVDAEPPKTTL